MFETSRIPSGSHLIPRTLVNRMALREELRSSGDWLFRRRGHLPLLLFPALLAVMAHSRMAASGRALELSWEAVCVLVALTGEAIRVAAVGFTPNGTSEGAVAAQRADALNTDGMYSVVRHPLYLGNLLLWMGVALFPANPVFALVVLLGFWLYYERIMFAEEEFLRERYGAAYLEWAARTPAVLPRLRAWRAPGRRFSLRRVLVREHSSVLAVVTSFAALDVLDDYAVEGHLVLDPMWGGIFGVVLVACLAVIALKRTGRLRAGG
jgi:protein-S-isoprenylcysteine O-methyltransferase Ste14